jgi:hypothetical protein
MTIFLKAQIEKIEFWPDYGHGIVEHRSLKLKFLGWAISA